MSKNAKNQLKEIQKKLQNPPPPPKVTSGLFVVLLEGQGDINLSIVHYNAWNWLNDRAVPIPNDVLIEAQREDEEVDYLQDPANQCWHNDRAIRLIDINGRVPNTVLKSFLNLVDYTNYIRENNIKVLDEYRGYIY